ncbi:HAD family phosphatase [archaeon]|jgi:beta-phosphoglucomutase family hydrolase|nr:HAD family phosphatase [archaeon]MBT4647856.1 HAD family phosphatase [archaeon]MBT6821057.1 HAD family phosphatase [archaeon]MBT7392024.1 HAD family phosphatase [archaeon]
MIKGVIFDMDGVIIDSANLHLKAWQIFLKKHGKEHTKEEFQKYFGMANKELFQILLPEAKKEDYRKLDDEKEAIYRDLANIELNELSGAKKLIKKLYDNGFKLIVGSSGHPENIEFNLNKLNLSKYFQGYVSNHEVEKGKPAPDIFLKCAQKLKLNPNECIVIEDAHHGIDAANNAEMKCIAITSTHDKEKLKDADLIVDTLNEITIQKIKELE